MGAIDDEVARLIAEGGLTPERGRSSFFRGAIGTRLRKQLAGTEGGDQRLLADPELLRQRREQAGVEAGFNAQERIVARREAAERIRANAESKRLLAERTGQARLATANAALAKTRTGGEKLSEEAARLLNIDPSFVGKVSPTTARTAASLTSGRERLEGQERNRELSQQRIVNRQRENNRRSNERQAKEARIAVQAQLSAIDKQLGGTSPEDVKQVQDLFKKLLSESTQGNALPEDQVEFYRQAARDSLGPGKTDEEYSAEALRLAEEDGFEFLPDE